jgi:uncharacterized Zn-binding protein involved in type VI secretion
MRLYDPLESWWLASAAGEGLPMGTPGAKEGDKISGVDTHFVLVPSPAGPVPTPMPMPFIGTISEQVAGSIFIQDKAAATEGSVARCNPAHVAPGGSFLKPPSNQARVFRGSTTVFFENKPAARMGDPALTCNDPTDAPNGTVVVMPDSAGPGAVFVGG